MPRRSKKHTRQRAKMVPKSEGKKISQPVDKSGNTQSQYQAKYMCKHFRQEVVLEGGVMVLASASTDKPWSSYGQKPAYGDDPDIGFYLDRAWQPYYELVTSPGMHLPWAKRNRARMQWVIYPWSDFQDPDSIREFELVTRWLLDHIMLGKRVEVGCVGGHGRTGTLLASLLILQGVDAWSAIDRIRHTYCEWAVESLQQERFLEDFDFRINGRQEWPNKPRYAVPDDISGRGYWGGSTCFAGDDDYRTQVDDLGYDVYGRRVDHPDSGVHEYRYTSPATLAEEGKGYKSADDEADYELWLRLNNQAQGGVESGYDKDMKELIEGREAKGLTQQQLISIADPSEVVKDVMATFHEEAQTQVELIRNNDTSCAYGPCAYPTECNAQEGECWKYITMMTNAKGGK